MTDRETILLSPADAASRWADPLRQAAGRARTIAESRLGLSLKEPTRILTLVSEREFFNYLGGKPAHIVAVARPDDGEIVILRPAWFAAGAGRQERILVHEFTHILLGTQAHGRLPAWLDEGLAMLTAGEMSYTESWQLTFAGTLGGLIPLSQLEHGLVNSGRQLDLAYAESLSVTRFLLGREGPGSHDSAQRLAGFARELTDPDRGTIILRRVWDPYYRDALEYQWRRSQRTLWTILAALSGAGILWLALSAMFLLAYWRKRRMTKLKLQRLAEADRIDEALGVGPLPYEYEADEDDS